MNRRSFLMGGGIVGVAAAAVSLVVKESQPMNTVQTCKDFHEPDPSYIRGPAITISNSEAPERRTLVPCIRCGTLLALNHVASDHRVGISAIGWAKPSKEDQQFLKSVAKFREC